MTQAFPLQWPPAVPRTKARKDSSFRVSHSIAFEEMMDELNRFGARSIVVSTNIPLRRDGSPYRDGLTEASYDPGVAVYFMRGKEPACIPCDTYRRPWENCRAIGKAIEALRSMERNGAGQIVNQAFRGFPALPSPDSARPWHVVLGVSPDASPEDRKAAYRALARTHNGNDAMMAEINAARGQGEKQ